MSLLFVDGAEYGETVMNLTGMSVNKVSSSQYAIRLMAKDTTCQLQGHSLQFKACEPKPEDEMVCARKKGLIQTTIQWLQRKRRIWQQRRELARLDQQSTALNDDYQRKRQDLETCVSLIKGFNYELKDLRIEQEVIRRKKALPVGESPLNQLAKSEIKILKRITAVERLLQGLDTERDMLQASFDDGARILSKELANIGESKRRVLHQEVERTLQEDWGWISKRWSLSMP